MISQIGVFCNRETVRVNGATNKNFSVVLEIITVMK